MSDSATAANGTAPSGGGDPAAPMDAQPSAAMAAAGDEGASKELVEMLKKQLAEKQHQVASLRVFQDHYQAEQRSFLTKTQEAAIAYTKELDDGASTNNKQYTESLRAWSANLHTHPAETLEQQMPLGILIDCASADKKRAREAESVATETADALKASNEKCDGLEVEKEKYRKLYTEMQALANERQQQAEELAMRNAQITGAAKRHDFTFQTSREVRPPAPATLNTGLSAAERAAEAPSLGGGGLASTLDVASGGKARMAAPAYNPAATLANFIHQSGGGGGGRIMRTSTTHGILGGTNDGPSASGSSGSDDVAAAIRATAGMGM
jgi:hypothetical protein